MNVLGSEEDDEFLRKEQGEPGEGGQFDVIPLYSERATAPSLGPRGGGARHHHHRGPPATPMGPPGPLGSSSQLGLG
ncbi:unnamed protein product [Arctogadus glacialis]